MTTRVQSDRVLRSHCHEKDAQIADLTHQNGELRQQVAASQQRITALELQLSVALGQTGPRPKARFYELFCDLCDDRTYIPVEGGFVSRGTPQLVPYISATCSSCHGPIQLWGTLQDHIRSGRIQGVLNKGGNVRTVVPL
jgi:hypothetical protein